MGDFIIFSNICNGHTLVRKSAVKDVYENADDQEVTVTLDDGTEYETTESFDSIVSKLTK